MGIIKTEAIILKQFDLGEADKIITFYTRDYGKVRAAVKGVRKTKNSLSGLVQSFNYCEIKVYRGRSLARLNQVEGKYSFSLLREDLHKMAYASYMAEMVEKVGMEDNPNPELFSLLLTTYHKLLSAGQEELDYINLIFKVRILSLLGFKPQLQECIDCGREVKTGPNNYFSIAGGGILCPECRAKTIKDNLYYFNGEARGVLKKILDTGLKLPPYLKISGKALEELDDLIDRFIIYHLDLNLKSTKFLHMIRNLG